MIVTLSLGIKFIGWSLLFSIQFNFAKQLNRENHAIRWSDQEKIINIEEKQ